MWHDRVEQWERNVARTEVMLEETLGGTNQMLAGRYQLLLNQLRDALNDLRATAAVGALPEQLWADLAALEQRWKDVFGTLLDILGGVAITRNQQADHVDSGLMIEAQTWLDALRKQLGLSNELVVIPASGALLHTTMGVVRVPFLEWDCLRLPLLGRALGLLAAAEDGAHGGHLAAVADLLIPQVQALEYGEPPQPVIGPDGWERQYIDHVFADMFAVAVLGPVYAIATYVLDFEWGAHDQPELGDPDVIEERATSLRFLPSPVARAAAMLATLRAWDADPDRRPREPGPYQSIIGKLEQLAQEAGIDLAPTAVAWEAWHSVILDEVMPYYAGQRRGRTGQLWQAAETKYWDWSRSRQGNQLLPLTAPEPDELTTFLSAIWLYRMNDPERTAWLRDVVMAVRKGHNAFLPRPAQTASAAVIIHAWIDHADRRWQRFQDILQNQALFPAERMFMVGRFLRLLSEQVYSLQQASTKLQDTAGVPAAWQNLRDIEDTARPLRREILEFLGGVLVKDREPAALAGGTNGPSVRTLADDLLRDYAARTGVNWSAHTVVGRDPFVEAHTDVIRVRFPDWSLWSLPLLAHEFGHLVAQATPRFRQYQRSERREAARSMGDAAAAEVARQIEEFFADIFAVYTMGPAFACDAILLEFNPAEAYKPRGQHPTHAERVGVILQTLRAMNEKTRDASNPGQYSAIMELLAERWSSTLADTLVRPADETLFARQRERSLAWGVELLAIIERSYRLGCGYVPERWVWAQKSAQHLVPLVTSVEQLQQSIAADGLGELRLLDLLNTLWYARVGDGTEVPDLSQLHSVAMQLGRDYEKR